jgi:RHS repeat-associated protein
VRNYGSYPFGGTWYETLGTDKWKFTSYENDSESGLNYAGARYQSVRVGRFTALDPVPGHRRNPQSLNRYTYANNDPINLIDPTGMESDCNEFSNCDDSFAQLQDTGCASTFAGCDNAGDYGPAGVDFNDLPDAPTPQPEVMALNIDFVFNGGNSTPEFNDLSALTLPTVQSESQIMNVNSGGDDVAVDMDLWHNSSQCQGCGTMWRQADTTGKALFIATGIVLAAPAVAEGLLATPGIAINAAARGYGLYLGVTGTTGVVLGQFDEFTNYVEAGESMGANYLNLSPGAYNFFSNAGAWWTLNQSFLQASVSRGQQFYMSSPVIGATGNFALELDYLTSQGVGPAQWLTVPIH